MADIAELGFAINTNPIQSATAQLNKMSASGGLAAKGVIGVATAAATAATAIAGLVAVVGDQVRETDNWANILGVTTTELQQFGAAAESVGLDAEKMNDILKDTNEKIGEALATGAGEGAEALDLLGVNMKDLADLPVTDKLRAIGDALGDIEGQAQKSAIGEMIASDFTMLLPLLENGNEELEKMLGKALKTGQALSSFDNQALVTASENFSAMGKAASGATRILAAEMSPAIVVAQEYIQSMIDAFDTGSIETFVSYGIDAIGVLLDVVKGIELYVRAVSVQWTYLSSVVSGAMSDSADSVAQFINIALWPMRNALSGIADAFGGIASALSKVTTGDVSKGFEAAAENMAKFAESASDFRVSGDDIVSVNEEINESLDSQVKELKALYDSPAYSDQFRSKIKAVTKEIEAQAEAEDKKRIASNKAGKASAKANTATKDETSGKKELTAEQKKLNEQYEQAAERLKDLADPLREIEREWGMAQALFDKGLISFEVLEETKKRLDEAADKIGDAGAEAGKSFSDAFLEASKDLAIDVSKSIASGDYAGAATSITDVVGNSIGGTSGESFGIVAGNTISAIDEGNQSGAAGSLVGGAIGSIWGPAGSAIGSALGNIVGSAFEHEATEFSASLGTVDIALTKTSDIAAQVAASDIESVAEKYAVSISQVQAALKNNEGFFEWQEGIDSFGQSIFGAVGFINDGTERLQRAGEGGKDWVEPIVSAAAQFDNLIAGFAESESELDAMRDAVMSVTGSVSDAGSAMEVLFVDRGIAAIEAAGMLLPERFKKLNAEEFAPAIEETVGVMLLLSDASSKIGGQFDSLDDSALAMADSIALAVGGIDNLTTLQNDYYSNYFSEEERMANLRDDLTKSFAQLNLELPKTKDELRNLVAAQDKNTESGASMYASLLQLSGAFDQLSDYSDSAAESVNDYSTGLSDALGSLSSALESESASITGAYSNQIDAAKAAATAEQDLLNSRRESTQGTISSIESLRSSLASGINQLQLESTAEARVFNASDTITDALIAARAGNLPSADLISDALSDLADINSDMFATDEEAEYHQLVMTNKLKELDELAGDQLSIEEKTLKALDSQILSSQLNADAIVSSLESQRDAEIESVQNAHEDMIKQAELLLGIDSSILSVADAVGYLSGLLKESQPLAAQAVTDNDIIWRINQEIAETGRTEETWRELYDYATAFGVSISRIEQFLPGAEDWVASNIGVTPTQLGGTQQASSSSGQVVSQLAKQQDMMQTGFAALVGEQAQMRQVFDDIFTGDSLNVTVVD